MKRSTHISILYLIIVLLLIIIAILKINSKEVFDVIVVDGTRGEFFDDNPVPVKPEKKYEYIYKDTLIIHDYPVDSTSVSDFIKAEDVVKVERYIDATSRRQYKDTLDNDDITINYDLHTKGYLDDIHFEYEIKPKTVTIPKPKEVVFSLYGGGGLSVPTHFDKMSYHGTLGFQGKNKDIITIGYGNDHIIRATYMFNIFNIKK